MNTLFSETEPEVKNENRRLGSAAQYLVVADIQIRGYDAAIIDGLFADIVMLIDGNFRKLQVKSSISGVFNGSSGRTWRTGGSEQKTFIDYRPHIDGFVFVHTLHKAPYYIHPNAVNSPTLNIHNWGRQACDMSFNELLRRWGAA